ncbi:hypothetical protein, partial [Escherichia coli]
LETATQAVDLSGSVRVSGTLDVMSGGYVSTTGSLVLDGKGGNVSLSAATTYAAAGLTNSGRIEESSNPLADKPLGGTSQSVDFTPLPVGGLPFPGTPVLPQLVPD